MGKAIGVGQKILDPTGMMGKAINPVKGMLGLSKTNTGELDSFRRTPEQIAAENKLLSQLSGGLGKFDTTASELANRQALAMAAGQSRQASNPFLGIKAAQSAQMEGQEMAKMNEFERQSQNQRTLSDLIQGQRQSAQQAAQAKAGIAQADQQRRSSFVSNLGSSGAGLAAAMSDENKKDNIKSIKDSGGKIDDFLSKLDPYTFEYKNDDLGGEQMGVMAQDLEKSDVGSALVENHPDGKKVRMDKIGLPILAAQSDMFKRIKELEDKVKKRA